MINQEEITIKVSSEIARAYRQASQQEQEQIQLKLSALLQSQVIESRKEKLNN